MEKPIYNRTNHLLECLNQMQAREKQRVNDMVNTVINDSNLIIRLNITNPNSPNDRLKIYTYILKIDSYDFSRDDLALIASEYRQLRHPHIMTDEEYNKMKKMFSATFF